jgi:hypothetical protein
MVTNLSDPLISRIQLNFHFYDKEGRSGKPFVRRCPTPPGNQFASDLVLLTEHISYAVYRRSAAAGRDFVAPLSIREVEAVHRTAISIADLVKRVIDCQSAAIAHFENYISGGYWIENRQTYRRIRMSATSASPCSFTLGLPVREKSVRLTAIVSFDERWWPKPILNGRRTTSIIKHRHRCSSTVVT